MSAANRRAWTTVPLSLAIVASALALSGAAPAVAGAAPAAPVATGAACVGDEGVTVVVDYQDLGGDLVVGCAEGEQASGFAALTAAGFTFNEDPGAPAGAMCQISGLPEEGYPYCWYEGYWSYWKSNGSSSWGFASTGPAAGPLTAGSVEGWSWDGPGGGAAGAPRIAIDDLGSVGVLPLDCEAVIDIATFDIIDDDEVLPVSTSDGRDVEVAVLGADEDPATAVFEATDQIVLADESGPTRVLARRAGDTCPGAPTFEAIYDVRDAYAPRWDQETAGAPSPAIDKASDRLVAFATGHSDYSPGANVNDNFKTPVNAYGPIDSSLVVLGDRGSITMTFDTPITDGPGYDLAVFENGFASGAADYLELAYVEVSSNGTDFVRFDSASRRATPVASFGTQLASELGGVAGKDLAGKGTPFDLSLLANKAPVISGAVDLEQITHVRIQDIVGDGADLDSFGRPIYDPNPLTGSAGFDLQGIGVVNEYVAPPLTADQSWATAAIEDFLGRAPAEGEVDAIVARLEGGARRSDVARELAASPEWVEHLVRRFYADTLGREPDPSGLAHWIGQITTGRRTVAQVAALFYSSPEYYRTIGGGTDETWIADLYDALLGRPADQAGLDFWVGQVATRGRERVAREIYGSPESRRDRVRSLYDTLLGRAPDPSGLAHWTERIAVTGDLELAVSLTSSAEYGRIAQVRFP